LFNSDEGTDLGAIVERVRMVATEKLREWNWHKLVAKDLGFQQTLFDHSLATYDVLATLLPELDRQLSLSRDELLAMLLAAVVHDAGKETERWQEYRRGERGYVSDTDTELSERYMRELARDIGFEVPDSAVELVRYHMKKSTETPAVVESLLRDQDLDRWAQLSKYVAEADNLASCPTLSQAERHWKRSAALGQFWDVNYHRVRVRGVITPLLHEAAQAAYRARDWTPLLYFSEGTVYVRAGGGVEGDKPQADDILAELARTVAELLDAQQDRIVDNLMVGNITATYMPKPELFDYRKTRQYLLRAGQTINQRNANQITRTNGPRYLTVRAMLDAGYDPESAEQTYGTASSVRKRTAPEWHSYIVKGDELSEEKQRAALQHIGEAYKEIAIFKYFKSIVDLKMTDAQQEIVAELYDDVFGPGTFTLLMKTGQFWPARDVAFTVDYYWRLPGSVVGSDLEKVEALPETERWHLLANLLAGIATKAFEGADQAPTVEGVAADITEWVKNDLIYPRPARGDIRELAAIQLEAYEKGKNTLTSQRKQLHVCPVCNDAFEEGRGALADFSDNPEAFTNRGTAYARFGGTTKPQLCMACYAERLVRQVALGRRARELVFLFPRGSVGPAEADRLVERALALEGTARTIAQRTEWPGLDFSMGMVNQLARRVREVQEELDELSGQELARLFSYKVSSDRRKREISEIRRRMADDDWSVEELADATGQEFTDLGEAAEALWEGTLTITEESAQLAELAADVRGEVVGSPSHIGVVARTANAIIIAGSRPGQPDKGLIPGEGDSTSNAALKELLVSLVLGLGLGVSVAALHDQDAIDADMVSPDGLVWLEPVPALQHLFGTHMASRSRRAGSRWIPLERGWAALEALVAACGLINRAGFPSRSDLYSIMATDEPGKLLRRIEQEHGAVTLDDIERIEKVMAFTQADRRECNA